MLFTYFKDVSKKPLRKVPQQSDSKKIDEKDVETSLKQDMDIEINKGSKSGIIELTMYHQKKVEGIISHFSI